MSRPLTPAPGPAPSSEPTAPTAAAGPPPDEGAPLATVAELEAGLRQLHRMELATRQSLERVEALVRAAIRVLHRAGVVHDKAVALEAEAQRGELAEAGGPGARVVLGRGEDKYQAVSPEIDCAALLPLCKARCCRLTVALDPQDLDEGLRWDYQRPYELRRRPEDGYCVYAPPGGGGCDVYDRRPWVCRVYDCRGDRRVWEDFEKRIPAAWDDALRPAPLVQLRLPARGR